MNEPVDFLATTFKQQGFNNAVIAVSGGVDSATSLGLVTKALGADHVFPLFLPFGSLNRQGVIDGQLATRAFGIPDEQCLEVDIQPLVEPLFQLDTTLDAMRKGNIMARMRMILVFDAAKKHRALVIGTENKTEHLLGYYTRFGDEASDVEPLRQLYKTQVYELAARLGVPEPILKKAPTAGLWEGQTDEGEFGFSYKEADKILALLYDQQKTTSEVIAQGFKTATVDLVVNRAKANAFKHTLPFVSP